MSTPEEETERLSRDATHSTYTPAPTEKDGENPPPGPGVIQTLGKPAEASSSTSSRRSSSSSS